MSMVIYLYIFLITFFISLILTISVKKIAIKLGVVDEANSERKIHKGTIPLLGGFAVFLSFFVVAFIFKERLLAGDLQISHWAGVFLGALVIMIGGFLDDKYGLKPSQQLFAPFLAILAVVFGGVGIEKISNPFGSYIYLDVLSFNFSFASYYFNFSILSFLLIFYWLLGMMYTTKILDGLDGLVTGVSTIGAFIIFAFTMTDKYYQADIAWVALMLAGASLGFLVFNWYPAKIFLGEGGSLFLGYILGVLAIISGGKIAIALLVMGLPIMDLAWTIIRRVWQGKNPFKFSDRKHLHFRLVDSGLGQKKSVLVFYFFSGIFGLSALFLQSVAKLYALILLALIMFVFILIFNFKDKNNSKIKNNIE